MFELFEFKLSKTEKLVVVLYKSKASICDGVGLC